MSPTVIAVLVAAVVALVVAAVGLLLVRRLQRTPEEDTDLVSSASRLAQVSAFGGDQLPPVSPVEETGYRVEHTGYVTDADLLDAGNEADAAGGPGLADGSTDDDESEQTDPEEPDPGGAGRQSFEPAGRPPREWDVPVWATAADRAARGRRPSKASTWDSNGSDLIEERDGAWSAGDRADPDLEPVETPMTPEAAELEQELEPLFDADLLFRKHVIPKDQLLSEAVAQGRPTPRDDSTPPAPPQTAAPTAEPIDPPVWAPATADGSPPKVIHISALPEPLREGVDTEWFLLIPVEALGSWPSGGSSVPAPGPPITDVAGTLSPQPVAAPAMSAGGVHPRRPAPGPFAAEPPAPGTPPAPTAPAPTVPAPMDPAPVVPATEPAVPAAPAEPATPLAGGEAPDLDLPDTLLADLLSGFSGGAEPDSGQDADGSG